MSQCTIEQAVASRLAETVVAGHQNMFLAHPVLTTRLTSPVQVQKLGAIWPLQTLQILDNGDVRLHPERHHNAGQGGHVAVLTFEC